MTTRRLALAFLGAAFGLVVAVVPAGSVAAPAVDGSHAVLTAGHLDEAVLAVAHPRTLAQLPSAVGTRVPVLPADHLRPAISATVGIAVPAVVTPPAAIRGPPA
ncbi:MAG TPA: hypothetical protein VFH66_14150 [Mycobacteriales bacterium]|nr:hypothetical protein [Mycobacteriales bacterium]